MQIRHILMKDQEFKSSPLKLLNQIKANLAGVVPFQYCVRQRRPPFRLGIL